MAEDYLEAVERAVEYKQLKMAGRLAAVRLLRLICPRLDSVPLL